MHAGMTQIRQYVLKSVTPNTMYHFMNIHISVCCYTQSLSVPCQLSACCSTLSTRLASVSRALSQSARECARVHTAKTNRQNEPAPACDDGIWEQFTVHAWSHHGAEETGREGWGWMKREGEKGHLLLHFKEIHTVSISIVCCLPFRTDWGEREGKEREKRGGKGRWGTLSNFCAYKPHNITHNPTQKTCYLTKYNKKMQIWYVICTILKFC